MSNKSDKGWNDEPQGGAAPKFDRSKNYTPYTPPKDISRRVDGADDNSGFAGKLPSNE